MSSTRPLSTRMLGGFTSRCTNRALCSAASPCHVTARTGSVTPARAGSVTPARAGSVTPAYRSVRAQRARPFDRAVREASCV
eukprot:3633128-Pyramimonas_sp.AAC.1